jgi:hypothetical protein
LVEEVLKTAAVAVVAAEATLEALPESLAKVMLAAAAVVAH